jgi:DNA-directed RNA polymerase specialized sigma24 family protein
MAFNQAPSPEKLEHLLDWLDPDRERASSRYLCVRTALVKIFETRGCHDADQLADLTIDRVMEKAEHLAKTFEGDPTLYFYGVAKNVLHERFRRPQSLPLVDRVETMGDETARLEARSKCLDKCLVELETPDAELITAYYSYNRHTKADVHVQMARKNRVSVGTLRIRAYRIRKKLRDCLKTCIENL